VVGPAKSLKYSSGVSKIGPPGGGALVKKSVSGMGRKFGKLLFLIRGNAYKRRGPRGLKYLIQKKGG